MVARWPELRRDDMARRPLTGNHRDLGRIDRIEEFDPELIAAYPGDPARDRADPRQYDLNRLPRFDHQIRSATEPVGGDVADADFDPATVAQPHVAHEKTARPRCAFVRALPFRLWSLDFSGSFDTPAHCATTHGAPKSRIDRIWRGSEKNPYLANLDSSDRQDGPIRSRLLIWSACSASSTAKDGLWSSEAVSDQAMSDARPCA
jgi:hypothetical protein